MCWNRNIRCCIDSVFWVHGAAAILSVKSEISNICNAVEGHCLQAMKIVRHHANGCFDWLISRQQSINPSREAISILSDLRLSKF